MDQVEAFRLAVVSVFREWGEFTSGPLSITRVVPVLDPQHDRYVLLDVDPRGERFRSMTLAHLEIRDGKIWILTDNTEVGIATELVAAGIPKTLLAYYRPSMRKIGEFAVA